MILKRLSAFLAIFALSTGLVLAGSPQATNTAGTAPCERPLKHLNCQDLNNLQKSKGCIKEQLATPVAPVVASENTCTNTREVITTNTITQVPGPAVVIPGPIVEKESLVQPGQFLLGGGPVFLDNLGATLLFGYQFRKSGIILLGGPLYVPNDGGRDGMASYDVNIRDSHDFNAPPGWIKNGKACPESKGGHGGCDDTYSYTVPGYDAVKAPSEVDGQILVIFPIGKRR